MIHTYIGFQYVSKLAIGYSISPWMSMTRAQILIYCSRSVIADYLPKWRVPFWRKAADWGNLVALIVVGYGWYEFETNDVGLTEGIKRIWKAGSVAEGTA